MCSPGTGKVKYFASRNLATVALRTYGFGLLVSLEFVAGGWFVVASPGFIVSWVVSAAEAVVAAGVGAGVNVFMVVGGVVGASELPGGGVLVAPLPGVDGVGEDGVAPPPDWLSAAFF
jgi:hypothetical protein